MRKSFSKNKVLRLSGMTVFALAITCSSAQASVMSYDAGTYESPENYEVSKEFTPVSSGTGYIEMRHANYFTFEMADLPNYYDPDDLGINIVFHNIANDNGEDIADDILNVWLFDGDDAPFEIDGNLSSRWDGHGDWTGNEGAPDWEGSFNAISVGSWTDTDDMASRNDVVFHLEGAFLASIMQNSGTFGIGIDPDCKYTTTGITVETPVPEPATMLLFGTGLAGLAGFTRRRKNKKA